MRNLLRGCTGLWLLAGACCCAQAQEAAAPQEDGPQLMPGPQAATPPGSAGTGAADPAGGADAGAQPGSEPPAAAPGPQAPNAPVHMEEVVVTATRRAQSIGKVPVAVTEVTGASLENNAIRDTQSLQMAVPSLVVSVSGSESVGTTIRIRGVGTTGSNAGFESAVGVFIDGIYIPRPGLALNDLVDIDRVEILRGPQGTLFGKNTSVGAINILTRPPGTYREADLSLSHGDYDGYIATAVVGGGLFDDALALRFAGQYNVRDGYIENLHDGQAYNDRNRYQLRGEAAFHPLDAMTVRLGGWRIHKDERCCAAPYTHNGATPANQIRQQGGTVFEPTTEYTTAFDHPLFDRADQTIGSLHLDWDLGGVQAKGIFGYQSDKYRDSSDADYNDLDILRVPFSNADGRFETAELSFHGEAGPLDWIAGAFYSYENIRVAQAILFGDDAGEFVFGTKIAPGSPEPITQIGGIAVGSLYGGGTGETDIEAHQLGESWSVFTHDVIKLGAGFELTGGARFLHETKDGGGFATSNSNSCNLPQNVLIPTGPSSSLNTSSLRALCAAPEYAAAYSDNRVTWTAALSKSFSGGKYLYASVSSGFKAGGVNLNPPSVTMQPSPADPPGTPTQIGPKLFDPETVRSYEVGGTLPLFDNLLVSRATLFYMDIAGFQLNTYNGTGFVPSNAGGVFSKGAEFETSFRGIRNLAIRASFTYADAVYKDDEKNRAAGVGGKQLTNAPRWTVDFGPDYRQPLPFWNAYLLASLIGRYQSATNAGSDLDPNKYQGGYTLLNGRIGLTLFNRVELSLWGTNLTDKYYRQVIFNSPAQTGSYNGYPGLPRMLGGEVRVKF